MLKNNTYIVAFAFSLFLLIAIGCQQPGGNKTGSEYMPDMAHSIAYEANYYNYYYNNTWGSQDEYYEFAKSRLPVEGTIARGAVGSYYAQDDESKETAMQSFQGLNSKTGISFTPAGSVPYYYEDTEEERTRAINEIIDNPYKITDAGLATGKELYVIFCATCHGDKGDGAGYLARDEAEGGKYPVQPANMLLDEFVNASNGRYYHSIMYGKNMMGAYKDKLSYEERWQVIHYIRSLQAKEKKLVYNQFENTLNSIDVPAGEMIAEVESHDEAEGNHSSDESHHSDDH